MAHIKIKPYLDDLSKDIIRISDLGHSIQFQINSKILDIGLKTIVPLGLLINELITNSIKHAFVKIPDGEISIEIGQEKDGYFSLIYSDNGEWQEPNKSNSGFGLGLIKTLIAQLEGSLERKFSTYTITLKNLDN